MTTTLVQPVRAARVPQAYGTILVCGGGCYGGYYVRQLARAVQGGALACERVVVLDRDPHAPVARLVAALASGDLHAARALLWRPPVMLPVAPEAAPGPTAAVAAPLVAREDEDAATRARLDADLDAVRALPLDVAIAPWDASVPAWLDRAAADPATHARDALVPSPLMPHLTAEWVAARLSAARGGADVVRESLPVPPATPWERAADDGSAHYASFATWICPINCVEPATCPHTRGPRDWSMPVVAARLVADAAAARRPIDAVAVFHTEHRTHGVGMFDLATAARAARAIEALPTGRTVRVLVGSVSHCHGAFALLAAVR
jgi:hypothetical protein